MLLTTDKIIKTTIIMIREDQLEASKNNKADIIKNQRMLIQTWQIQVHMDQDIVLQCKHNKVLMDTTICMTKE